MNPWGWKKMRNGSCGCSNETMRTMRIRIRMRFCWIRKVSRGRWGCSRSPTPGPWRCTRGTRCTTGPSWPRKVPGRWECSNGSEPPGAPWESGPTSGRWGCSREVETWRIVSPLQVADIIRFTFSNLLTSSIRTAPLCHCSWSFSLSGNQNLDQNLSW